MFKQPSLMKQSVRQAKVIVPVLNAERELMALSAARNWPFRVVGVAPVPNAPIFHKNWWLVPMSDDHSQIPVRALGRVQAIYEAGIRPKAFVIAHEAPPRLPAPADAPQVSKMEFWSWQIAEHSLQAVSVIGKVLNSFVIPLLQATLSIGLLLSLGLASAIITDPCLIAITENDVWIQIDHWNA